MGKSISYMDIENAIGNLTDEICPDCKSNLLADKSGVKWCSSDNCYWSNDDEMSDFKRSLC